MLTKNYRYREPYFIHVFVLKLCDLRAVDNAMHISINLQTNPVPDYLTIKHFSSLISSRGNRHNQYTN